MRTSSPKPGVVGLNKAAAITPLVCDREIDCVRRIHGVSLCTELSQSVLSIDQLTYVVNVWNRGSRIEQFRTFLEVFLKK